MYPKWYWFISQFSGAEMPKEFLLAKEISWNFVEFLEGDGGARNKVQKIREGTERMDTLHPRNLHYNLTV